MDKFSVVLFLATALVAQSPSTNKDGWPHTLSATSRVSFNIPMFGAKGDALCDASGNFYFDVSNMLPTSLHDEGPFLKIEADGSHHQVFTPHLDASERESDTSQGVSPDGTFYILVHTARGMSSLQKFDDNGLFASSTDLDLPRDVTIEHWAVQNNGTLFLMGHEESAATPEQAEKEFATILRPDGRLLRKITNLPGPGDAKGSSTSALDGDVVAGDDGQFYVLTPSQIVILSQSGEADNTIHFKKPTKNALAGRIDVSAGIISVIFYTPKDPKSGVGPLDVSALLFEAQDGEVINSIEFADSTTKNVICFTRDEGYSLLAIENRMAAKDVVPVR